MKIFTSIIVSLLFTSPVQAEPSREQQQAKLDAVCETAREKKLAPMRAGFVKECIANEELPSREDCERFYADYGNRMGGRAPLFYDLPDCVAAFEFEQSSRSRD